MVVYLEMFFCSTYGIRVWIKHKELYSDKFLDQEVEIPQEEE